MRRTPLLAVLALLAASTAPAAQADSTTTQTVPPGGTMRSSPDAAPSPANPVIVTLVAEQSLEGGCRTNCQQGDVSYTITIKDKHDRGRADGLEGPNGYDYVGPQVDVTSSQTQSPTQVRLAFEVDSTTYTRGFNTTPGATGITADQFTFEHVFQDGRSQPYPTIFVVEKLADGDLRLTPPKNQFGGDAVFTGSFDLTEQSFYTRSGYNGDDKGSLQTALRKGVLIDFFGNYEASVKAKITVSPSVAKRLKLKSTTLGTKTFPTAAEGKGRIKLTRAAVKALKKYKKVVVYIESASTRTADGQQVKAKKTKTTLTTKTEEDDELG